MKEALATEEINIDEIVAKINKFLKINQLDEILSSLKITTLAMMKEQLI